jgi:outer membrane protein
MIVLGSLRKYLRAAMVVTLSVALFEPTLAQTPSAGQDKRVFTLEQAVDFALENYPAVRASLERVRAAEAGVGLARTNYLPRADILLQANRATDNNITGLLPPQPIIAPISSSVPLSTSNQSAWGSAAGLLFSWEPRDFGYRGAKVDAARAGQDRSTADASLTRLDVRIPTINAYMTLLAAEQTARAANADVQRWEEFATSVHVLGGLPASSGRVCFLGRCRTRPRASQPGKSAAAGCDKPCVIGRDPLDCRFAA